MSNGSQAQGSQNSSPLNSNSSSSSSPQPRPSKTSSKRTNPTFHFIAGLFSGISSAVLLQPADLLKTRVQQSNAHTLSQTLRDILSGPRPLASLWRGTVPSALRTGLGSALYFTCLSELRSVVAASNVTGRDTTRAQDSSSPQYGSSPSIHTEAIRERRSTVLPKLSNTQNLVTGATARVLAGFILMPMTVIKVRYESNFYAYKSLQSATASIFQQEGLRGFFTGFGATAIRDAPYAGLYVVIYEGAKTRLNAFFPSPSPSAANSAADVGSIISGTAINAGSGIIAATTATALTNPFDAVKTRLQLMPGKYGNMVRAARMMLREDGVRSFFDGLGLRMARKAASSALAWTVYEELIGRAQRRLVRTEQESAAAL